MNCPHCQKSVQEDFSFCPYCGVTTKTQCPSCRKDVKAEWANCPHCGIGLKKQAAASQPFPGHAGDHGHAQPYPKHRYGSSSSGHHHRRKKSLLERFFS